jgi:hypothetical protein
MEFSWPTRADILIAHTYAGDQHFNALRTRALCLLRTLLRLFSMCCALLCTPRRTQVRPTCSRPTDRHTHNHALHVVRVHAVAEATRNHINDADEDRRGLVSCRVLDSYSAKWNGSSASSASDKPAVTGLDEFASFFLEGLWEAVASQHSIDASSPGSFPDAHTRRVSGGGVARGGASGGVPHALPPSSSSSSPSSYRADLALQRAFVERAASTFVGQGSLLKQARTRATSFAFSSVTWPTLSHPCAHTSLSCS